MRPGGPWAVLDVEISELPAFLDAPQDAQAALVILRLYGAFVGRLQLLPGELPLSGPEIIRLATPQLARFLHVHLSDEADYLPAGPNGSASLPAGDTLMPFLKGEFLAHLANRIESRRARKSHLTASIIVCTLDRPAALRDCLECLSGEIAAGREVIVVDNGSNPETEAVVRAKGGCRYVVEPRRGLSRARNMGIVLANGDIAVFVDDDVRPEPGWIEPLLAGFSSDRVAVVCGLVLPKKLETDAQVAFELFLGFGGMGSAPLRFDSEFLESCRRNIPVWNIGAGANMAVRCDVVNSLGGFDERIGPGAAGGCGDDSEFWHRALFAGYEVRYEPLSVVRHLHRKDWESLRLQAFGYYKGHVAALFAQYGRQRDPRDLKQALFHLPKWMLRKCSIRRASREATTGNLSHGFLWRHKIRGYLAGLAYLSWAFRRSPGYRVGRDGTG